MLIVTGGAGFIGSNLVTALNQRGRDDVMVVDDLRDGRKLLNLVDCDVFDVVDKDVFREWLSADRDLGEPIEAVFHQGACADTLSWDGRLMLRDNYEYSKMLLSYCTQREIPLIYASSAAVYGASGTFREEQRFERPLNPYGYSKLLFDQLTRRLRERFRSQVVGLRYFNVYGPREAHKDEMASVAYKHYRQLQQGDRVELFRGSAGYDDGEQRRDFLWVGDCVAVNLWFLDHPDRSGIFNAGTGRAQSFNDVGRAVIGALGRGRIEYVPMPEALAPSYQSFTEADVSSLRKAGYDEPFLSVEDGVARYIAWLERE
jgi:ADP-L-glycero-D-manno-heptose 6-epimerase